MGKKYSDEEIRKIVEDDTDNEYELVKIFKKEGNTDRFITIIHKGEDCNREYDTRLYSFIKGYRCKVCSSRKGALGGTNTIENFKKFVLEETNNEYECLSDKYKNAHTKVKIIHKECSTIYEVSPASFIGGNRCPRCSSLMVVSYTHAILALLYERYYNEVHFEYDAGFRTNKNGISKYDLYVKDLNLLIEFQSRFHDTCEQKIIDKNKKEYAIDNGYNYLAFDHRDKTAIEYIKMLFPWLDKIPQDLDLTKFYKADISTMQELLDDGLSIREVVDNMEITEGSIRNAINSKRVVYPDFYKDKFKQNIKVVQLSLDGKYINTYDSIAIARKTTNIKSISNVINKKLNHAGGYFWAKYDDYINKNYELPNKDDCMFYNFPILQYDKKGKLIKMYNCVLDAVTDNINAGNIYSAIESKTHYSKDYYWIKEEDKDSFDVNLKKTIHHNSKIIQLTLNYEFIKKWDSQSIIKKEFSKTINLHRALNNNRIAGGYRWMYEEDYEDYLKLN